MQSADPRAQLLHLANDGLLPLADGLGCLAARLRDPLRFRPVALIPSCCGVSVRRAIVRWRYRKPQEETLMIKLGKVSEETKAITKVVNIAETIYEVRRPLN